MMYPSWKRWARGIVLFNVAALLLACFLYAWITFFVPVPFEKIFSSGRGAGYYLATYLLMAFFSLSLWGIGIVLVDIFGHRELKARIISRGLTVTSTLSTTIIISLIAAWNVMLINKFRGEQFTYWIQHSVIWMTFYLTLLLGFLMTLLYSLAKTQAHIPKKWSVLCLIVALLFFLTAISTLFVPLLLILFRVVGLLTAISYIVWGIWLAVFLSRIDRA